ncbi:TonB-dependent receptor plug domain-containing protein, partial [Thermovibrio ammonificans]
MRRELLALSALVLALAAGASAQEPEVTVTATRVAVPVDAVGDDVTVITRDEIERYGFTSITDVLKYVAGISFSSNGGPGQTESIYMLGLEPKHVLVMVNGVPVYDPSLIGSEANFSYIDLSNVERIEVIKGPQGAIYGSDAVAGVINIITKSPKKTHFSASFEGGKYKTFKEDFYSGLKLDSGYLSVSFENFKTNGFSATNSDSSYYEPDRDGYRYKTGWFSFGYRPTDTLKISGDLKVKQGSVDYDNSYTPQNDKADYSNFFADLKVEKAVTDSLLLDVTAGHNREFRDYTGYGPYTGIVRYLSVQPVYYLNDSTFLTGGVNYRQEVADFGDYASAHLRSLFAELHTDLYGAGFTAAVRRDFHSQFGAKTTYKLSAAYNLSVTDTTFKAQYGTGFKAPSLYQLFGPYGSSDLKPETSEGWSVGAVQKLSLSGVNGSFGVTYFKNHVWNMIDMPWCDGVYKYVNYAKVITEGAELTFNANITRSFSVFANYTHLRAVKYNNLVHSWSRLLRRPKFSYTLGFNTKYDKLSFSAWALHYSDRDGFRLVNWQCTDVHLGGFTTYNFYASYALNDRVKLYAKGVNLTDKKYYLAYGYNT